MHGPSSSSPSGETTLGPASPAARRRPPPSRLRAARRGRLGLGRRQGHFWFLLIIFLLGYIPNLAYYFTVGNTVEVGYNAIPIVNSVTPATTAAYGDVPAPRSPARHRRRRHAVADEPAELALPAAADRSLASSRARTSTSSAAATAAGPTADVLVTTGRLGRQLPAVDPGPALPEPRDRRRARCPRRRAVRHRRPGRGRSPTETVYVGSSTTAQITGWVLADGTNSTDDLTLPVALSDAAAVAPSNGIYLFGGRTADGVTDTLCTQVGTTKPPARCRRGRRSRRAAAARAARRGRGRAARQHRVRHRRHGPDGVPATPSTA